MNKNFFVFRNFTVEPFFEEEETLFSGYGDVSYVDKVQYYIWFYMLPLGKTRVEMSKEVDFYRSRFDYVVRHLPVNKELLSITMTNTDIVSYDINDPLVVAIEEYNRHILEVAETKSWVKVLDFSTFTNNYSIHDFIDMRHFYMFHVPMNPKLAGDFSIWFKHKLNAIQGIRKKCLVIDLDNTLWGGILGEEGLAGIQVGNTYPGNCYVHFQTVMKEMKEQGILLAVCSKNNQEEVQEVFEQREEMVLKRNDFVAMQVNWKNKTENIKMIALDLNIDTDSMVFIDDSPFEREQVKTMLPEVIVPEFPDRPYHLFEFIKKVYEEWFQVYELTDEDKRKTEQYMENSARKKFIAKYDTEEDFLRAMKIELTFYQSSLLHLFRIAQMTQKTNQFNLTTKRYKENDLLELVNSGHFVFDISVRDKFGDNGITAASIIKINGIKASIDTFLLSCRILGRGIETAFLKLILNRLFEKGIKEVTAMYLPTGKNKQVEYFYKQNGFDFLSEDNKGQKIFHIKLLKKFNVENLYAVEYKIEN